MCKKMLCPFVVAMLCVMLTPYMDAQTREMQSKSDWVRLKFPSSELIADVEIVSSVYYDEDDNVIKHGKCSAHKMEPLNRNGVVGKLEYTASCTYNENKLNGPLTVSLTESFTRPQAISLKRSLSANYTNGVPSGKWVVTENGQQGSKSENYTITVTWKDGEITSLVTSKGSSLVFERVNPEALVFSFTGKWGDESFVKGINKNYRRRKVGYSSEQVPLDDAGKAILQDIEKGNLSIDGLVEKGYIADRDGNFVDDIFGYWEELIGDNKYFVEGIGLKYYDPGYVYRCSDAYYSSTPYMYPKMILQKVSLKPAENIMQILKKNQISQYTLSQLENLNEQLDRNFIYDSESYDNVYFSNETKRVVKDYVMIYINRQKAIESLHDALETKVNTIRELGRKDASVNEITSNYLRNTERVLYSNDSAQMAQLLELGNVVEETAKSYSVYNVNKQNTINSIKSNNPKLLPVFQKIIQKHQIPDTDFASFNKTLQSWNKEIDAFNGALAAKETIATKDAKIKSIADPGTEPVLKAYNAASKANKCEITVDILKSLEQINEWEKAQDKYISLCEIYRVIAENDNKIAETEFKDILKVYQGFRKSADLQIGTDLDASIDKANQFVKTQEGCLEFIVERGKIAANNNQIIEGSKSYKNINKAYSTYYKGLNMAWSPTSTTEELKKIESVQDIFSSAIAAPNAAELDKQVKALKDKSIQSIINILEKK